MKNKKIKLLVVTPYFYPKIGGLENYAFNISKNLMKDYNYEIVVITSNHENKEYKEENLEGMKIYRLPPQFKISNTPISFKWKRQIKNIIQKENPDIINAHSPVPFIADITCRIANKKRIPFVLSYHAVSLYKKKSPFANIIIYFYHLFLGNRTFKLSDKILPVSDFVKKQFSKDMQYKSEVIYNAMDKKEINLKKSKKEYDLIFLGNLDKTHSWKGLDLILISIKNYIEKFDNDIKLLVVGDGNYKYHYEEKVKEFGLNKNVKFAGANFGKEKINLIKKSKILITYPTTSNDAFPTIFLEAWANGLPIISSEIGPIPYLIKNKEDGFLVETNNHIKLTEGINELLNNKKLQDNMIKNGYKKVKENFTWDISAEKMNKLIKGVLK